MARRIILLRVFIVGCVALTYRCVVILIAIANLIYLGNVRCSLFMNVIKIKIHVSTCRRDARVPGKCV